MCTGRGVIIVENPLGIQGRPPNSCRDCVWVQEYGNNEYMCWKKLEEFKDPIDMAKDCIDWETE